MSSSIVSRHGPNSQYDLSYNITDEYRRIIVFV